MFYSRQLMIEFGRSRCSKNLSKLHYKYVAVPADKTVNSIVFAIKTHLKKLGVDNKFPNSTYISAKPTKKEYLDNHRSVLSSFRISFKQVQFDFHSLNSIPNLHYCPNKQSYIAVSVKCSIKPLFTASRVTEKKTILEVG